MGKRVRRAELDEAHFRRREVDSVRDLPERAFGQCAIPPMACDSMQCSLLRWVAYEKVEHRAFIDCNQTGDELKRGMPDLRVSRVVQICVSGGSQIVGPPVCCGRLSCEYRIHALDGTLQTLPIRLRFLNRTQPKPKQNITKT